MPNKKSIRESLQNSGLVGGSQIINIIIGIFKTKLVAILLGPSGIGLIELFTSSITLFQNIFSLGLGFSGVRDISESFGTRDKKKISSTFFVLNKWVVVSAILGVMVVVFFSRNISSLTFNGTEQYWMDISLLSVTIIFANLAGARSALVRGTRNMHDFVRINVINAFSGAVISISIYYFLREEGIVFVLISTSIVTYLITYYYSKKIRLQKIILPTSKIVIQGWDMVKLGLFTVLTGFISQLSLYYIKVHIGDNLGIDYIGYYTVATTLTVSYMSLVFGAMAADYFPKLSAINKNNKLLNDAVLEQTKIVLLLGTPLILMMYTFSEYIIIILYSSNFLLAQTLLMLMLIGVFLRLIGFPMGYVFLAKSKSKIFIFTQTQWNVVFILLSLFLWNFFEGLVAVGIAFVFSYIIGVIVNFLFLNKLTKFNYDVETIKWIFIFSVLVVVYFIISYLFSGLIILSIKLIGLILISLYCFRMLEKLIEVDLCQKIKNIIFQPFKKYKRNIND